MSYKNISINNTFEQYFKNTSYLIFEKILRMILWVFIFTWMARYLGTHNFGIFSYVESIISFLFILSTLGLDSVVIKELVKNKNERDRILGTTFILKIFTSIIIVISVSFYSLILNNEYPTNMLLLVISITLIFNSFNVFDLYFQSLVLSKYVVFSKVFALIISSLIKILLIMNECHLIYFGLVILFENILIAIGYIFFYLKKEKTLFTWKFDLNILKTILLKSYPLFFALILATIYSKIDQIMIKEILGVTQSGYYAAAVKLSEIWFIIGGLVCSSLFPIIIKSKDRSSASYYKKIQQLLVFLIFCAYIIILFVFFLSDQIILTLYGEKFHKSSLILNIHIISTVFVYMGIVSNQWVILENRLKLEFYKNLVGVIINIVLNYIFIKKFGIIGAAYSSLITYIMVYYIFDLFIRDTRKMFLIKSKALFLITKGET